MATHPTRKRRTRADGERSYRLIVNAAARLATIEGLEGLSIGRLAQEIGMSKSGLYAHFESKQELQLATIAAAEDVYAAEVVAPALEVAEGLERLELLCERYLSYVERGVFPGGCFFASTAAEWDSRRGPIRDRVRAVLTGWSELLEASVRTAQEQGDLGRDLDPAQLTFEINAMLHEANGHYLLFRDPAALDRAREAIDDRLKRARA
jgi:AcrR family transcriptional regulator